MTALFRQIEDLDVHTWAELTKGAAKAAVAAAARLGTTPSAEVLTLASMSERELVDHRNRCGPARKRLSTVLQLVQAEQLQLAAERRAAQAHQDKLDAETAAAMVRAQAEQSAREAAAARERAREANEKAAQERAYERAHERQVEQELRAELERVRADSAAALAEAQVQTRAAEARAEQRLAERASERAAAQHAVQELRAELERVRADSAADVAARQVVHAEIVRVRAAEVDLPQAELEAAARPAGPELLTIPIPGADLRAHTGAIEEALSRVALLDYTLEAGLADKSRRVIDGELVDALVANVEDQAGKLSDELGDLAARFSGPYLEAACGYADAVAASYRGFLHRIAGAAQQLAERGRRGDAEVAVTVTRMLDRHPWWPVTEVS